MSHHTENMGRGSGVEGAFCASPSHSLRTPAMSGVLVKERKSSIQGGGKLQFRKRTRRGRRKVCKIRKKRTNRWEGIRTRRREIHSEFHVFLLITHCAANKEVGRGAYNRESAFTVR